MSDEIYHLTSDKVVEAKITEAPPNRSLSGYGFKVPTKYMLKVNRGRRQVWHRVYSILYGNSGSAYVLIMGERHFLDVDTQHMLEALS